MATRASFLNKKLKDLNPMSLLEPAVFGQRVRALVHRYYASYIKTGSFAPIWHATFVFGGAGVAISYHVRGEERKQFSHH